MQVVKRWIPHPGSFSIKLGPIKTEMEDVRFVGYTQEM